MRAVRIHLRHMTYKYLCETLSKPNTTRLEFSSKPKWYWRLLHHRLWCVHSRSSIALFYQRESSFALYKQSLTWVDQWVSIPCYDFHRVGCFHYTMANIKPYKNTLDISSMLAQRTVRPCQGTEVVTAFMRGTLPVKNVYIWPQSLLGSHDWRCRLRW
jgi:hypothetical protein